MHTNTVTRKSPFPIVLYWKHMWAYTYLGDPKCATNAMWQCYSKTKRTYAGGAESCREQAK